MSAPAYTSVAARRTLVGAPPGAPAPPPPATQPKREFPPAVREYVQRCFENPPSDISRQDLEAKLKEVVGNAMTRGTLTTTDWPSMPLVGQLIKQEREQAKIKQNQSKPLASSSYTNSSTFSTGFSPQTVNGSKKRKSMGDDSPFNGTSHEPEDSPPTRKQKISTPLKTSGVQPQPESKRKQKQREFRENLKEVDRAGGELERRRQRFGMDKVDSQASTPLTDRSKSPAIVGGGPVIGTCQDLEKRYFRLTAPPKPETVRPLAILRRAFDMLKSRWKEQQNYGYICDQFKSMRQDLTVQHIRNEFTVSVYECHARIALEMGDMGEYNQCQSQLRALYRRNLGGNPGEFLAYRIFYFLFTRNRTDMNDVLADLPLYSHDKHVRHALQTRRALALGNYHDFFRLYNNITNMGGWIMDKFIARERLAALAVICKSYRQVAVSFLTGELAFVSQEECANFLCDYGAANLLDKKGDDVILAAHKATQAFETARNAAFRGVDIKGQI